MVGVDGVDQCVGFQKLRRRMRLMVLRFLPSLKPSLICWKKASCQKGPAQAFQLNMLRGDDSQVHRPFFHHFSGENMFKDGGDPRVSWPIERRAPKSPALTLEAIALRLQAMASWLEAMAS